MTVLDPARRLLADLGTRVKLRGCASVGPSTTVLGRVWVRGKGEVHLAEGVVLDARAAPIELCAHRGAEIRIGAGVRIEGGASLEAVSRIEVGAEAKLGSFCKILDNHFHPVGGWNRERRPPSRPVMIEERAEVGARAILLPGARVGSGAVVPAGAVISRSFGLPASRPPPAGEDGGTLPAGRPPQSDGGDLPSPSFLGRVRGAIGILRAAWYLRACQWSPRVRATGFVRVMNEGTVRIGDRTTFLGGMIATAIACRPGASIEIGSRTIFNYGVSLEAWKSIRIGSRAMFGSLVRVSDRHDCLAGPVVIGDDVWIAHGATIEPGVTVGSGSVVAAGSVVSCDVPPGSLAIGNPARCMSLSLRSNESRGAEPTGPANAADAG
jgi:acetyltransferase-like isoleucine patch superfamily enzyme